MSTRPCATSVLPVELRASLLPSKEIHSCSDPHPRQPLYALRVPSSRPTRPLNKKVPKTIQKPWCRLCRKKNERSVSERLTSQFRCELLPAASFNPLEEDMLDSQKASLQTRPEGLQSNVLRSLTSKTRCPKENTPSSYRRN